MSQLNLSGRPAQEPLQNKTSKSLLRLFILSGALFLLAPFILFFTWKHYSQKYGQVDHSADTLETIFSPTQGLPGIPVPADMTTVYRNAQGGVSLKLPGSWHKVKDPAIPKPDVAHRFCVLSSHDLMLMFWPLFPDLLPSLDADAKLLRTQFTRPGGFQLKGEREVTIGGRRAKEMEFLKPGSDLQLNLVVIREWPVIYTLAITGAPESAGAWKQFEDALPKAVEIE